MVTLKDIALRAGVSISTVSHVLNNQGRASVETEEKIRALVKELHYVPNHNASSLRTKQSKTIGVLVPQFDTLFFVEVVKSIEDVLYSHGYNMLLSTSHEDLEREQKGVQSLLGQRVAGLMITSSARDQEFLPQNIDTPVVKMYESNDKKDHYIYVDNYISGYLLSKHILERHLYPVACVGYGTYPDTIRERFSSLISYMEESGHPILKEAIISNPIQSFESGYQSTIELIKKGVEFRSIFACTDVVALGVLRALSENGFSVPKDVAVIGYDNTPLAKMSLPALTTVDMQAKELGKQGAKLLIDMIEENNIEEQQIMLTPRIVVREST